MMPVAVPDYLRFGVSSTVRMFRALTQYPSLDRMLALRVPTLAVLGNRDPLMPSPSRVQEVASRTANAVVLAVIEGAAHAINFSHPGELANVIRLFMADQPIVDDPDSPGHAAAYEIHRGVHLPLESRADEPTASMSGDGVSGPSGGAERPDDQHIDRDEDDSSDGSDRQLQKG